MWWSHEIIEICRGQCGWTVMIASREIFLQLLFQICKCFSILVVLPADVQGSSKLSKALQSEKIHF